MKEFYNDFGFVIGFLICVLLIQASFGDKWSERFCLITILGMLVFNYTSFSNFLSSHFTLKEG